MIIDGIGIVGEGTWLPTGCHCDRNVFKKLVPICAVCPLRQLGSGIFIGSMTEDCRSAPNRAPEHSERRNRSKKKRGKRSVSISGPYHEPRKRNSSMEAKRALRQATAYRDRLRHVTFTPAAVVCLRRYLELIGLGWINRTRRRSISPPMMFTKLSAWGFSCQVGILPIRSRKNPAPFPRVSALSRCDVVRW